MHLFPQSTRLASAVTKLVAASVIFLALADLGAQTLPTTISVTGATTTMSAVRLSSGAIMTDPISDQQTGQNSSDFVSLAAGTYSTGLFSGTAGSALTQTTVLNADAPGFFVTAGQLSGVDSLMFRFVMHDQNGNKGYLGGYVGVGIDLGGQGGISAPNGAPDLFLVVDSTSLTPKLLYKAPGTGLNLSPNTTSAGNFTTTANTTLTTGTTFNYSQTVGTTYSDTATAVKNYDFTFAISWSNLSTAIANLPVSNTAGTGANYTWTNFGNVDANTQMAFFFFTSQQANAFNQDIGGGNIAASSTATWSSLGAFSTPISGDGRMPSIPEFATVAQTGLLLLVGGGLALWRRRQVGTSDAARS